MTRRCLTPIASILAILALSWVCAGAQGPAYRPGELLVQYKPKARSAVLSRAETRHGDRVLGSLAQGIIQHVALPSDMSVEHAMVIYAADPDVILVEPNYLLSPQSLPQDPYFEKQWGLHNTGQVVAGYTGKAGADIDLIEAWRVADGTYGAIVAVVDTGCNLLHPDLLGNLWTNPG
ncbi:MAG: hypothetical protein HKP58_11085, partial [Desulfatitalea sp.]|nr:hypothetical protein [Desulfatitalea sp.]NNK00945.1 hypothetical protein [Desulfatitalea sp.]